MPEKSQVVTVAGTSADDILAIAHGIFLELKWTIKYAGKGILIGYTPRSWKKYDNEITVQAADDQMTVTSKMVHGESFDMMGRTKKDIAAFIAGFETLKPKVTASQLSAWQENNSSLETETIKIAEQEIKQAEEVDKVMNLSSGNRNLTYIIMGLNVLVFVAMAIGGVNVLDPLVLDLLKWGANNPVLTFGGEWWRLFTCMFIHIGILHLLLNMYALYFVSIYLEPMLGKTRYIAAYICTGLLSSLVSAWWHKETGITSAGASGAIFGMYGVFLALLTTNIIPKQVKNTILQSILIFVAYNIFYGLKENSGVDNSAHLGGLISGMVIGYAYYFTFKNPSEKKIQTVTSLLALVTCMSVFFILRTEAMPPVKLDYSTGQTGNDKEFNEKLNQFAELEVKALEADNDSLATAEQRIEKYERISLPAWQDASNLITEMQSLASTPEKKKRLGLLREYVTLRKQLTQLSIRHYQGETPETTEEINKVVEKINNLFKETGSQ